MLKIAIRATLRCPHGHRYNPTKHLPGDRRASCQWCGKLLQLFVASTKLEVAIRDYQREVQEYEQKEKL